MIKGEPLTNLAGIRSSTRSFPQICKLCFYCLFISETIPQKIYWFIEYLPTTWILFYHLLVIVFACMYNSCSISSTRYRAEIKFLLWIINKLCSNNHAISRLETNKALDIILNNTLIWNINTQIYNRNQWGNQWLWLKYYITLWQTPVLGNATLCCVPSTWRYRKHEV